MSATALCGVLPLATAGQADSSLRAFYVFGKPITLSLPATWVPKSTAPSQHLPFLAYAPNQNVYAGVSDGFPPESGFAALAQYAVSSQRQFYATQYPAMSLRHRQLKLSIGQAEQVIVVIRAKATDGSTQRHEIDSYWFALRGQTYNFSCVFPIASAGSYVTVCDSAARSLRPH